MTKNTAPDWKKLLSKGTPGSGTTPLTPAQYSGGRSPHQPRGLGRTPISGRLPGPTTPVVDPLLNSLSSASPLALDQPTARHLSPFSRLERNQPLTAPKPDYGADAIEKLSQALEEMRVRPQDPQALLLQLTQLRQQADSYLDSAAPMDPPIWWRKPQLDEQVVSPLPDNILEVEADKAPDRHPLQKRSSSTSCRGPAVLTKKRPNGDGAATSLVATTFQRLKELRLAAELLLRPS